MHILWRQTDSGIYIKFQFHNQQAPKRAVDVSSPAQKSPAAKRKRKPAEHYQSDVIDACSKQIRASSDSKREVFLPKGVYVAVRSEDGRWNVL